jgi:hypothetical protein
VRKDDRQGPPRQARGRIRTVRIERDGLAISVEIPAGMTLGEIVDSFIQVAFAVVAELYGSGATENLGDGNPAVELLRAESCLRAVWRAIQKGSFEIS